MLYTILAIGTNAASNTSRRIIADGFQEGNSETWQFTTMTLRGLFLWPLLLIDVPVPVTVRATLTITMTIKVTMIIEIAVAIAMV